MNKKKEYPIDKLYYYLSLQIEACQTKDKDLYDVLERKIVETAARL